MATKPSQARGVFLLTCLITSTQAHASCGASFCTVNADWQALGQGFQPGWHAKLQFEYLDQDQLRRGSETVSRDDIHAHHAEVRTINRNWLASLDYGINHSWGLRLSIPYLIRSHSHIHYHHGKELYESWKLNGIGDARVLARHQFLGDDPELTTAGVTVGLKLPTGEFHERNDDGDQAERSLQLGSGTTDLILGLHSITPLESGRGSLFAGLSAQLPMKERDGFRPGNLFQADVGWAYPLGSNTNFMVQANIVHKQRDKGVNSEPEDTGSTQVSLSPGIGHSINPSANIYAFLQVPLYQRVNGVQLSYDNAMMVGLNWNF